MHVPTFIERKRDGHAQTEAEIAEFIRGYTAGEIPDYQVSAWAMAVFFHGMSGNEISALTRAMRDSGTILKWPAGSPPKVDKHSTGGIGDKVSLILAPLLACAGVWVPMISGRGLGITGGTLDKLESIPGFRVRIEQPEALAQLERIGVVMMGQTANLCPADRKLYALRDVTGTVPSIPMLVASIMSKKLAESLDRLVLDVKFGSGAFMKTRPDAEALAAALCAVGKECGLETTAILNPMDQPLGRTAGNALEVWESVETLQGRGPEDLVHTTVELADRLIPGCGEQWKVWLQDGTAWKKWCELVEAQGGNPADTERIFEIHRAPLQHMVKAKQAGRLEKLDAEAIGRACVVLGGGRSKSDDAVDFAVGCSDIRKVGEQLDEGDRLLTIHARNQASLDAALALICAGIVIS